MRQTALWTLAKRWKWGVVPAALVLTLMVESRPVGAVVYNASAEGNMGTITITGTIGASITLTITAAVDGSKAGAACTAATTLSGSADTVAFGGVAMTCPGTCNNGDCYQQNVSTANYVATLNANLVFAGLADLGLEVYRAVPAGSDWASGRLLFTNALADDWVALGGGIVAIPEAPAAGASAAQLLAGTNTTANTDTPHQIAARVQSGDTSGARSSTITYRTF